MYTHNAGADAHWPLYRCTFVVAWRASAWLVLIAGQHAGDSRLWGLLRTSRAMKSLPHQCARTLHTFGTLAACIPDKRNR